MPNSNLKPVLHLIQKNISILDFGFQVNRMTSSGDDLIFMGDSVFDLTLLNLEIGTLKDDLSIYVIDSDIKARSLNHNLSKNIKLISFDDFVALTINAVRIISW
ncbi:MAG: sulfur relay protein TusB/DsrH [Polaribacter sp.]|jgi:sulfur relay protein TusB/DsrH